jgi:hypothetical protein
MRTGDKWRCANQDCQAEIVVATAGSNNATAGPQCGCGSRMKRQYEKPALRPLFRNKNEFKGFQKAQTELPTPEGVPSHLGEQTPR